AGSERGEMGYPAGSAAVRVIVEIPRSGVVDDVLVDRRRDADGEFARGQRAERAKSGKIARGKDDPIDARREVGDRVDIGGRVQRPIEVEPIRTASAGERVN